MRMLQLQPTPTDPVMVIDGVGDAPAHAELLCLVAPLPASDATRAAIVDHHRPGRKLIELAMPGIGARYLGGVAREAARGGWNLPELLALVVELESRCTYWVAAATLDALDGGSHRSLVTGRARALRWACGKWAPSAVSGSSLRTIARSATVRGGLCVCARSGRSIPRRVARELDELARSRIVVGDLRHGLATMLGASWAVEMLVAPRLAPSQLATLREQFVSAPRCGWCGIPVAGSHCRRCTLGPA
ncbi:MAG: hypothetical protein QOJ31_602 [Gaiellales bacterium]|nr:hypothetical protein [Gaiellales bacterium]